MPGDYVDLEAIEVPGQRHADLVPVLHQIVHAFRELRDPTKDRLPLVFWLNMIDQQVREAREHLAAGNPDKALAEVADCFSVGWQAIGEYQPHPEAFIVERLTTRVLPRARELYDRDVLAGRTGYKPGVQP